MRYRNRTAAEILLDRIENLSIPFYFLSAVCFVGAMIYLIYGLITHNIAFINHSFNILFVSIPLFSVYRYCRWMISQYHLEHLDDPVPGIPIMNDSTTDISCPEQEEKPSTI